MGEADFSEPHKTFDAMGRIAGAVAHDFNNLLTGILGNLELLQRRAAKLGIHDFDDYLRGSRSAANRAVDLTQRLLAVSGHLALEPKALAVEALVEAVIEILSGTLPASVQLKTELDEGLWPVFCDEAQLEDGLMQLVRNAQTAMRDEGQVTIGARNLPLNGPAHELGAAERGLCGAFGDRYRHGDDTGDRGARFRAVFHHAQQRRRHRVGAGGADGVRPAIRRRRDDRDHAAGLDQGDDAAARGGCSLPNHDVTMKSVAACRAVARRQSVPDGTSPRETN